MTDTPDTYLTITSELGSVVFPVGSARGIDVDVQPIDAGEMRRTVNGTLVGLVNPAFRKLRVSLSHSGGRVPTIIGLWRRMPATAEMTDPVEELPSAEDASEAVLSRQPVAGSVSGYDADGTEVVPTSVSGAAPWTAVFAGDVAYVSYRPVLSCLVSTWTRAGNDWGRGGASWSIELEEV